MLQAIVFIIKNLGKLRAIKCDYRIMQNRVWDFIAIGPVGGDLCFKT